MEGRPQTMQKQIVNALLQMKCALKQKCKKREILILKKIKKELFDKRK